LNPLVVNTLGPNINRRTVRNIRNANFEVLEEKYLLSSIFRMIVAKPEVPQSKLSHVRV